MNGKMVTYDNKFQDFQQKLQSYHSLLHMSHIGYQEQQSKWHNWHDRLSIKIIAIKRQSLLRLLSYSWFIGWT